MYRDYKYTSSVTAMLEDLSWRFLNQRRIDSRLVMLYKVTYDLVAIPASQYLTRNTRLSRCLHTDSFDLCKLVFHVNTCMLFYTT